MAVAMRAELAGLSIRMSYMMTLPRRRSGMVCSRYSLSKYISSLLRGLSKMPRMVNS